MSVLGIDIGTSHCVLATVGKGAVTIVRNEISERLTPSLVAFNDKRRLMGEAAQSQMMSNYRNTCRNMKNMLGRVANDPDLAKEEFFGLASLAAMPNGSVGYKVSYKGEEQVMSPTAVLASLFTQLRRTAEASSNCAVTEVVVAAPGWFTDINRTALLEATKIAGLDCRKIMNEYTATALDYGIYRSQEFHDTEPTRVVFVAVGHANASVAVVEFVRGSLKILAESGSRCIGGRDMDAIIMKHFAEIFRKQTGMDPLQNAKARLKMETVATKTKKILSANSETTFHCECLMEDNDCTGTLTRVEFEEMCGPVRQHFSNLMEKAMSLSGLTKDDLHHVEIVGGCTRIPWVQSDVIEFFGRELSRTLSGDECVARGCALQAAMCSSLYKVREFSVWDKTFLPIVVRWEGGGSAVVDDSTNSMDVDMADKNQIAENKSNLKSATIFESGSYTNTAKSLSFQRTGAFDIWASYGPSDNLPNATNPEIGHYSIVLDPLPDNSVRQVKLKVKLNFHGLFKVDKAQVLEEEEYEEIVKESRPVEGKEGAAPEGQENSNTEASSTPNTEEAAAAGAAKPTTSEPETKYVDVKKLMRRKIRKDLNIIVKDRYGRATDEDIEVAIKKEKDMILDDREEEEKMEMMNELESYVYKMRDQLSGRGILAEYMDKQGKESFLSLLQRSEDWLYDNIDASKSSFVEKLQELQAIGNPVTFRYEEKLRSDEGCERLMATIQECRTVAQSPDDKYAHIAPEKKAQIVNEANTCERWLKDMQSKQTSMLLCQDRILLSKDIYDKRQALTSMAQKIMSEPRPAPPPEPQSAAAEPNAPEASPNLNGEACEGGDCKKEEKEAAACGMEVDS